LPQKRETHLSAIDLDDNIFHCWPPPDAPDARAAVSAA
jgi:hypothetical protein